MKTQEEKDQALFAAAKNGHTETCKSQLEQGANIHARNDYALRWAAQNGHTEVCKLFLEHGADIHAENGKPLRWAAERGHTETCKLLLRHYKSLAGLLTNPELPELAKTLIREEQSRRAAQQLKKPQPSLEI